MINISWLMQFLEVTDRKSINKAAEELYISQSVLSRNIKSWKNTWDIHCLSAPIRESV